MKLKEFKPPYFKSMSDDRDILREVWEGKLPVCFTLAQEDQISMDSPPPIYLMVPRVTFFPIVTDRVHRQFLTYTKASEDAEIWLEYEDQPLKWHYPVGLLFDLYGTGNKLPWKITVHFSNFPEDDILHCPSKDAIESHLMSTVKEADALKHRGMVINGMQKRDHKQLWTGLQHDRFEQFWAVNRKLMELGSVSVSNTGEEGHGPGSGGSFRYIPCRLYTQEGGYKQRLVKPFSEEGLPTTYAEMISILAPNLDKERHIFLLHGIEVPQSTPVHWLSEHMSYPDNFLHISAVKR